MWNTFFKIPILNILFIFYQLLFHNLALAIFALTILIQIVLIPLRIPSIRSAKKLKELQPELDGIKNKHKEDKTALAKAQMELYRKHGLNPAAGCLPTLLSIPVMIALYQVLIQTLNTTSIADINNFLYFEFSKLADISALNMRFLWLDLAKPDPLFVLPVLVGILQWGLTKTMSSKGQGQMGGMEQGVKDKEQQRVKKDSIEDAMAAMQTQMQYIFPLMSALITVRLPAGVGLYWISSVLFAIIQQIAV